MSGVVNSIGFGGYLAGSGLELVEVILGGVRDGLGEGC